MAFCPLCGKKLPENGICSCGQKLDENGNIVSNVQNVVQQAPQAVAQAAAPMQQAPQVVAQAAAPMQQAAQQAPQAVAQAAAPMQQVPQGVPQQPVQPAVPKAPSGPNPFGLAFGMFPKIFKNPADANREALEGKLPTSAALILGGLYFVVVWWSMTFLLFGTCGISFLPAFGFGALGGVWFCGMRCGAAALISVFAKNPNAKFMKVLSALCVDSLLLDCILLVMMLFQFATVYFAVFFMLIYIGVIFYQNTMLLEKLSTDSVPSSSKRFWFNIILIAAYALLAMIAYIIYSNIPASAYKGFKGLSSWLDW